MLQDWLCDGPGTKAWIRQFPLEKMLGRRTGVPAAHGRKRCASHLPLRRRNSSSVCRAGCNCVGRGFCFERCPRLLPHPRSRRGGGSAFGGGGDAGGNLVKISGFLPHDVARAAYGAMRLLPASFWQTARPDTDEGEAEYGAGSTQHSFRVRARGSARHS